MPDIKSQNFAAGQTASSILGLNASPQQSELDRMQSSVLSRLNRRLENAGSTNWTPPRPAPPSGISSHSIKIKDGMMYLELVPRPINIAILTHNALDYTKLCLRSLFTHTPYPFNLFLFDNSSTDETATWLAEQRLPNLLFKLSTINRGVPGGRNALIEMMRPLLPPSSFVVFLDNDMEVQQGWADTYLNFFANHPDAAIVSAHGHRFVVRGEQRFLLPAPTKPEPVDVACGGFACWMRSEAMLEIGQFDENLGLFWHEDDDMSVRAIGLGWEVYSLPGVPVVHHEHKSGVATPGIVRDGSPENQRYLIKKWRGMGLIDEQGCIIRNTRKRAARTDIREIVEVDMPPVQASYVGHSPAPVKMLVKSASKPHIGIDARTFVYPETAQRGIGHYTFNHLQAIIRHTPDWRYTLYLESMVAQESLDKLLSLPNVSWASYNSPMPAHDLFHIPDPMTILSGYDSPMRMAPRAPATAVFYDLIPLICRAEHFDQWFPPLQASYMSRLEQLKHSDCGLLCISENTSRDLQKTTGIPQERITTIMAGLNRAPRETPPTTTEIQRVLSKFGIEPPFLLTVGGIDTHKNFVGVANSYLLASQKQPFRLVIAGSEIDPYKRNFKEQMERNGVTGVVFTGYLSREELECLYASAGALVFPSKYEGFGFPVLEAMAYGCPVITTNAASIPEVAGDAAIIVHPDDYQTMAHAMLGVLNDPQARKELRERGFRQAARFSWDTVAEKTLRVWRKLANLELSTRNATAQPRAGEVISPF